MILGQFYDICGPQGYGFHPIKNLQNCDHDFVAPFNNTFHNKTLCESGAMWIIPFATNLSIAYHIYLLIIITNVSILTDPAYFFPPSFHCSILALKSHDFRDITLTAKHVFSLFTFYRRFCTTIFIWNKIFSQPRVNYVTNINQKCYFLLWLFQLRWTLIQHFQIFHVNKPNTCFTVRVNSQKSRDLKARIP
jgi:hypothetical protein